MAKKNVVTLKNLVKFSKKLNDLELTDEAIEVDGDDQEELMEDFIQAIEEIDDEGQVDEIDQKILDFYEKVLAVSEGKSSDKEKDEKSEDFDRDELEEELETMTAKELKAFVKENDLEIKTKISKKTLEDAIEEILDTMEAKGSGPSEDKNENDDDEKDVEFDRDELEEILEDLDYKKTKAFIKENDLEIETKLKKKTFEDDQEDIMEEILDAMEEAAKEKNKKDTKKDKKGGKEKDGDLPKGMRKNSLPAKLYEEIRDNGPITVMELAKVAAVEKKKEPEQVLNWTVRVIAKSLAKSCSIGITFKNSSDIADGIIELND